jgi:type IV secretion system protein VirB9
MMGAPGTQWIVKTAVAGHHAIIAISPRFAGLTGNLQIFATGPRGHFLTYTIGLVSGQNRYTPKLSFYRNDSNPTMIHLPPATQNTDADGTEAPTYRSRSDPEIVASKLSVNWKQQCVTGNCNDLMPVVVANTRSQTFIRFPTALKTPPMVLPENRQGRSWYAPSYLTAGGKTLVVDAVPWRLDLLRQAPNQQMTEVRLNQGDDKGGAK